MPFLGAWRDQSLRVPSWDWAHDVTTPPTTLLEPLLRCHVAWSYVLHLSSSLFMNSYQQFIQCATVRSCICCLTLHSCCHFGLNVILNKYSYPHAIFSENTKASEHLPCARFICTFWKKQPYHYVNSFIYSWFHLQVRCPPNFTRAGTQCFIYLGPRLSSSSTAQYLFGHTLCHSLSCQYHLHKSSLWKKHWLPMFSSFLLQAGAQGISCIRTEWPL
jgi:hypothetical protein